MAYTVEAFTGSFQANGFRFEFHVSDENDDPGIADITVVLEDIHPHGSGSVAARDLKLTRIQIGYFVRALTDLHHVMGS